MKLNWGQGLSIVIGLGILGVLSMVYFALNQRVDLVTEDYYPKELVYQQEIEKLKNAERLEVKPLLEIDDSVKIVFTDKEQKQKQLSGTVHFYRPSDKRMDIQQRFSFVGSKVISFSKDVFVEGSYELILEWNSDGVDYLLKEKFYFE